MMDFGMIWFIVQLGEFIVMVLGLMGVGVEILFGDGGRGVDVVMVICFWGCFLFDGQFGKLFLDKEVR